MTSHKSKSIITSFSISIQYIEGVVLRLFGSSMVVDSVVSNFKKKILSFVKTSKLDYLIF